MFSKENLNKSWRINDVYTEVSTPMVRLRIRNYIIQIIIIFTQPYFFRRLRLFGYPGRSIGILETNYNMLINTISCYHCLDQSLIISHKLLLNYIV